MGTLWTLLCIAAAAWLAWQESGTTHEIAAALQHVGVLATVWGLGLGGIAWAARLLAGRQRQIAKAEKLLQMQCDLAIDLGSISDVRDALTCCLNVALEVAQADCGGIYLVAPDGGLELVVHRGLAAPFVAAVGRHGPDAPQTQLVQNGQPLYRRYEELPYPAEGAPYNESLRAIAILPISHNARVIACMSVASHTLDAIPPDVRASLETIAVKIGAAIARIQAEEAARQRQELLTVERDLALALSTVESVAEAVDLCIDAALCAAHRTTGGIWLIDAHGNADLACVRGAPEELANGLAHFDAASPMQHLFRAGSPKCCPGSELPEPAASACQAAGLRSVAILPVFQGDVWIATLAIGSRSLEVMPAWVLKALEAITVHLRAAVVCLRDQQRLRKLDRAVEQCSSTIVITDDQDRIEYVNPRFFATTGYTPAEVVGLRANILGSGSQSRDFYAELWQTISSGNDWRGEFHNRRKDGTLYWEAATISPITDGQGRISHYVAVKDDITARKQMEDSLRASEARLRAITDSARDAILMLDPEGKITYWNPAAEAILGYCGDEALGQDLHSLLAPERYRPAAERAIPAFIRTGRGPVVGKTGELMARHKDGQEIAVALSLSAVALNERWHAVGILRDITEQKLAEAQRAQHVAALETANRTLEELKEIAEAATRAKSAFLANMSHEIRTPMTAILGFADILLAEAGLDRAPPQRVEAIHTIQRNGRHLLDLINDILDLSKIEAGKFDVERVACHPLQIAQEVLALMQVRADAKGLALSVEYAGSLPETVHTDPLRVRQILINLLGNAIKFTEVGGVRLRMGAVCSRGMPSSLRFDVVDTGIGIAPAQQSELFQPFSQGESSTSRKYGGTGLGLAISKRLAEMLGGDIAVSSLPGQGSTFTLSIDTGPLEGVRMLDAAQIRRLSPVAVSASPAVAEAILNCPVLLAEDGPDNQRLIAFLLKKAGAQVTLADNGQEAHDQALAAAVAGKPFAVILMDMQMPVLDGYEATRRLRAAGYAGTIIALTANAMAGDEEECRRAGCDDYLAKPIDGKRLCATIARHVSRQAADYQHVFPAAVVLR